MTLDDSVRKDPSEKKKGNKLKTAPSYAWELGKAYLATKAGVAAAGIDAVLQEGSSRLEPQCSKKQGGNH